MRQCRGLTKEGKWVYGGYVHIEPIYKDVRYPKGVPHINKIISLDGSEWEVIPETVGQATGEQDKNTKHRRLDGTLEIVGNVHQT